MVGNVVTDTKTGLPLDGNGKALSESSYSPPDAIKRLFARVQADYQVAWSLQCRPYREFDGYSLLNRAKMDQETFGAYVGAEFVPEHKKWRWKGRKNTARNLVIGILAHVIAGMLFPFVDAYNDEDEEDKMTAKVMQILIKNHLKKANYELKFLFMMTSALVNPAVFVEIEYIEAMQRIKVKNKDGSYRVEEAVDELLSGLNLNILPIDSILLGDFYTFDIQRQPFIHKVRRISYDEARAIYAGKYFIDGVDQFDFVRAGMTRIVQSGISHQTLYDIDWTEADGNFVQEITTYYRPEDLEVTFVGGVYMGDFDPANPEEIYNCNPFKHRRMSLIGDKWMTIPVYPFAKSGFEPLDPSGRFAYYKSACFKEFWDDAAQNKAYQLAQDGMSLDVIKPVFMSGVAKMDGTVMVPGATIGMPQGATVTPYQLGPNIKAALDIMRTNQDDLGLSTQDQDLSNPQKGVTATASVKAEQNAKVILSVFGSMIADLVKQVGMLAMDDIVLHTTIGEIDATTPDSLKMKFKKFMAKGKENGKDVTNKIEFSTDMTGLTKEKANDLEWKMFYDAGGMETDQRNFKVNPYKFARTTFNLYMDADMIISKSMGTDQLRRQRAVAMMTNPAIMPFINMPEVVRDFVVDEFAKGDPEKYLKTKEELQQDQQQGQPQPEANNSLLNTAMGA